MHKKILSAILFASSLTDTLDERDFGKAFTDEAALFYFCLHGDNNIIALQPDPFYSFSQNLICDDTNYKAEKTDLNNQSEIVDILTVEQSEHLTEKLFCPRPLFPDDDEDEIIDIVTVEQNKYITEKSLCLKPHFSDEDKEINILS
jgi:hypothetical protein